MLPGFVSLQIRTSGRGKFIAIHTFPISDYEYKLYFLKTNSIERSLYAGTCDDNNRNFTNEHFNNLINPLNEKGKF